MILLLICLVFSVHSINCFKLKKEESYSTESPIIKKVPIPLIKKTTAKSTIESSRKNISGRYLLDKFMNVLPIPNKCYENVGCFGYITNCFTLLFGLYTYPAPPRSQNATFIVFTKSNQNNGYIINYEVTKADVLNSPIRTNQKIVFIVHGYGSGYKQDNWMSEIKNLIIDKGGDNFAVVIVDWSKGASITNYQKARANTDVIGALIGLFILKLEELRDVNLDLIQIIGHSLGSHVAGYAGKFLRKIDKKLGWITALDPAGPCFVLSEPDVLNPKDAKVVEAFHTDISMWGNPKSLGHYDVFIDGGIKQKQCGASLTHIETVLGDPTVLMHPTKMADVSCNHIIVTKYMLTDYQKYGNCEPVAYTCRSHEEFLSGKCASCKNKGCKFVGLGFQIGNTQIRPQPTYSYRKMYYEAALEYPFCNYLFQIIVEIGSNTKFSTALPTIKITFTGDRRSKPLIMRLSSAQAGDFSYALLIIPEKEIEGGNPAPFTTATLEINKILDPLSVIDITKIIVNYMSSTDERVRGNYSTVLCRSTGNWVDEVMSKINSPMAIFDLCSDNELEFDVTDLNEDITIKD